MNLKEMSQDLNRTMYTVVDPNWSVSEMVVYDNGRCIVNILRREILRAYDLSECTLFSIKGLSSYNDRRTYIAHGKTKSGIPVAFMINIYGYPHNGEYSPRLTFGFGRIMWYVGDALNEYGMLRNWAAIVIPSTDISLVQEICVPIVWTGSDADQTIEYISNTIKANESVSGGQRMEVQLPATKFDIRRIISWGTPNKSNEPAYEKDGDRGMTWDTDVLLRLGADDAIIMTTERGFTINNKSEPVGQKVGLFDCGWIMQENPLNLRKLTEEYTAKRYEEGQVLTSVPVSGEGASGLDSALSALSSV